MVSPWSFSDLDGPTTASNASDYHSAIEDMRVVRAQLALELMFGDEHDSLPFPHALSPQYFADAAHPGCSLEEMVDAGVAAYRKSIRRLAG